MNEKLLEKYIEHFGENFPIYAIPSDILESDIKLESLIMDCIDKNKPVLELFNYEEENIY